MTTVVISQPMYFPWPGFLAQLSLADVVIWLVDVQFSKGSFTNRVQVRLPGGMSWLSIPLARKGKDTQIIDLEAAKPDWLTGHIATLEQSFKGTPHRDAAIAVATQLNQRAPLCETLVESSERLAKACGVRLTDTMLSTEISAQSKGTERVLHLVKEVGGTRYVTGHGARNYLDHAAFEEHGISVDYMDYDVHAWGTSADFTPYVTALDLLAHAGPKAADYLNPKTRGWRSFTGAASGA